MDNKQEKSAESNISQNIADAAKGLKNKASGLWHDFMGKIAPEKPKEKQPSLFEDPDIQYFSDNIVPWIKRRYGGKGYDEEFYENGAMRDKVRNIEGMPWIPRMMGAAALTKKDGNGYKVNVTTPGAGAKIDRNRALSILSHEYRHVQNKSLDSSEGRSFGEDDKLSKAYGIDSRSVAPFYAGMANLDRTAREEAAATNAEYQFRAFQMIKNKLGRPPTPREFQEGLRGMTYDELKALRTGFGEHTNAYELMSQNKDLLDSRSRDKGYRSYDDLIDGATDPRGGLWEMIKSMYRLRTITPNNMTPKKEWTNEELDAFRKAMMEVAKSDKPGGVAESTMAKAAASAGWGALAPKPVKSLPAKRPVIASKTPYELISKDPDGGTGQLGGGYNPMRDLRLNPMAAQDIVRSERYNAGNNADYLKRYQEAQEMFNGNTGLMEDYLRGGLEPVYPELYLMGAGKGLSELGRTTLGKAFSRSAKNIAVGAAKKSPALARGAYRYVTGQSLNDLATKVTGKRLVGNTLQHIWKAGPAYTWGTAQLLNSRLDNPTEQIPKWVQELPNAWIATGNPITTIPYYLLANQGAGWVMDHPKEVVDLAKTIGEHSERWTKNQRNGTAWSGTPSLFGLALTKGNAFRNGTKDKLGQKTPEEMTEWMNAWKDNWDDMPDAAKEFLKKTLADAGMAIPVFMQDIRDIKGLKGSDNAAKARAAIDIYSRTDPHAKILGEDWSKIMDMYRDYKSRHGDQQAAQTAMHKESSAFDQLKDEIKFVMEGLGQNSITKGEAARSSAIGALAAALAGSGIGALSGIGGNKKNRRKRILRRAIIGALAGGAGGAIAGPAYAQLRKYLDGVPFDNSKFESAEHNKGDKVYLGVAGSANGENESYFKSKMRSMLGDKNVYMLRHVDGKKLKEKYDELIGKGLDVTIVGHSSGGATAGRFLREHPDAKGYLIDPVSWTGRGVPDNAVVFTSDKSTRHGNVFENNVADIGGRWNDEGNNSVVFKGSHSDRIPELIRDFVLPGVTKENLEPVKTHPDYVTSMFGEKVKEGKI